MFLYSVYTLSERSHPVNTPNSLFSIFFGGAVAPSFSRSCSHIVFPGLARTLPDLPVYRAICCSHSQKARRDNITAPHPLAAYPRDRFAPYRPAILAARTGFGARPPCFRCRYAPATIRSHRPKWCAVMPPPVRGSLLASICRVPDTRRRARPCHSTPDKVRTFLHWSPRGIASPRPVPHQWPGQ